MSDQSFSARVSSKSKSQNAHKPRRRTRLQVEELLERIVPSYFPSTADGIGIFEDQLPSDLSSAMTQFVATHIDGTQKELLSQTQQFRAINPNFTVLHYQLGTGNSPYDYILNNQWASDWNSVNSQESWFVHQSDSGEPQSAGDLTGGRVGNSTGWDQADISNPAWQQYTLNQVFQNMASTGSNGWFADSFTYGIGGAGYDGAIPNRYQGTNAANSADWPGGVDWTTQLGNWAQTIETAFNEYNAANGTNYAFIPNMDARVTSWEPRWNDNASGVPIMDGAFFEGFGEWTDTYDWTFSMNQALNFTTNNKITIMQPYPADDPSTTAGQQEINFELGTYLLMKGNQSYINIDDGGGVQYYPQYQVNLGAPTTPLPTDVSSYLWNGVYRRDFQNGFVLVNPGSTSYTLNLGGTYQEVQGSGGGMMSDSDIDANGNYIGGSLNYQDVSSVTMPGSTALIFLNTGASSPLSVATPANSAANPLTGTSVALNVLGQENGSDTGLTYTWSGAGPANVTFTANGTNAAKNTTADFAQAGKYALTATISDGTNTVTSRVTVTVNQTFTSIQLTPGSANVLPGATQQFSAVAQDQFDDPLATQPTFNWSIGIGSLGTITSHGLFTAPTNKTGSAVVVATSGSHSATATATVAASGTAQYVGADTTDQGNWEQSYGADGYDAFGAPVSLPSYAKMSTSGSSAAVWTRKTTDVRALTNPAGGRVAAALYSTKSFNLNVNVTDGGTHQVALYFLDWGGSTRSERIDVLNSYGQIIDTRTISSFHGGKYLVWNISGNVTFRITRLAGPNAVVSGVFFGGPKG
jgi:hypothetical protein